ncbi:phospholipase D-like domain-containing protein [Photobacterium sp. CCB-ST2H9]|uniref:phospholipase D-like domain-containing protein n=1 Tax=Photobacterium sp. CCB-ST2H9 TaxID=2912855 RepID=UPI002003A92F|nr:phospholipase D-like domain-containing protein [Photobacterium sp. CCB-ST2H9]UTM59068.1 phospholipase D-like domain-containing protein [Photobacterium sp. CCB-ST2H9]
MNQQQWLDWLSDSLQDGRLDDNERRELQVSLMEAGLSDDDRAYLRNQSFKLAQQAIQEGTSSLSVLRWLERVVKVLDNTRNSAIAEVATSWFSPGRACAAGIIEQLRQVRSKVDICVFTIADDELTKHILAAHDRGVKVRIITDNDKVNDAGSDIDYLARKGVPVKIDTTAYHMHHKFAVFDGMRLINGSFNWTRSASRYNQEDITLTDDRRFLTAFEEQFDQLWQRFPSHQPTQGGRA